MVCGCVETMPLLHRKTSRVGYVFFICKGMKNCRITQVFQQVFLGFFYCFFLTFFNLFFRCFPHLFLTFFSPFSICSYVSPLLQKWPLSPSVTPLREISQAVPCRTLLRSCPLSRTGDRSRFSIPHPLIPPILLLLLALLGCLLPLFAEKRCVLGCCRTNHWRALDFAAAGACFRGYFRHGGRRSKNVCKCLILLWLGCSGWMRRLGLDLLMFQLRTTSDASEFFNEVLDYECVSLSSCVSTHHRTIAP